MSRVCIRVAECGIGYRTWPAIRLYTSETLLHQRLACTRARNDRRLNTDARYSQKAWTDLPCPWRFRGRGLHVRCSIALGAYHVIMLAQVHAKIAGDRWIDDFPVPLEGKVLQPVCSAEEGSSDELYGKLTMQSTWQRQYSEHLAATKVLAGATPAITHHLRFGKQPFHSTPGGCTSARRQSRT